MIPRSIPLLTPAKSSMPPFPKTTVNPAMMPTPEVASGPMELKASQGLEQHA